MDSDIIPGNVANDDSPKGKGSNKAIPLHANPNLEAFIREQLLNHNFCAQLDAITTPILPTSSSAASAAQNSTTPTTQTSRELGKAWKILRKVLKSTKDSEASIYGPLSQFLTLLMDKKEFLFIPWDHSTKGAEGELYRQDIIVVNAQPNEIDTFLKGKLAMDVLPDQFRSPDKKNPLIYYSNIQMVCEVKASDAPEHLSPAMFDHAVHVLKYLFTITRYQPQHAFHVGMLAYRDCFYIIRYYPDRAFFSQPYKWEDKETAWSALRDAVAGLKARPFTTNQFALVDSESTNHRGQAPRQARLQFCLSGDFASSDAQVYQLFDLHRGHGWRRNAYVAIGLRYADQRWHWDVIKHYWHDIGRRFNELEVFKRIYAQSSPTSCTAGVVRVDLDKSRILGTDQTPSDKTHGVERQSVLIAMNSLGQALTSCSSVMKFLKVMYDLVEVHRMLVEDHQILHRDISWTNVLIDAMHSDEHKSDNLCGRPFIDVILGVGEDSEAKVHAMLSDFDCARILDSAKQRADLDQGRGEITGTPMFISRVLCLFPDALDTLGTRFRFAFREVFPNGVTGVSRTQRQDEVAAFQHDIVRQFNYNEDDGDNRSDDGDHDEDRCSDDDHDEDGQALVHAPMHDAESIFWLIVLFFLRAWPKGYDLNDPKEPERRKRRSKVFSTLARNEIGTEDHRSIPKKAALPPQLQHFTGMISRLNCYFNQAWHSLDLINEPQHCFHAHNALQSILLEKINELRVRGDEIEINPIPLGVDVQASQPDQKSYLGTKRKAADDIPEEVKVNKKQKVLPKFKLNTRRITRAMHRADENAASTSNNPVPSLPTFVGSTIDNDHHSKLWFMGDRNYVENPFMKAGSELTKKVLGKGT